MKAQTFILNKKKTFRRGVNIYVKGINQKLEKRMVIFTTEHLVNPKDRKKRARQVSAEYKTTSPIEIEALMRDSAYGKDFTRKDDPEGKLKEQAIVVTPVDAKKIALKELFKDAKLNFNEGLDVDVLTEQYKLHVSSMTGKEVKESGPLPIPDKKVDVAGDIESAKESARKAYEEKYGEPVPESVINDITFLDGMSNPDFDAKAYVAEAEKEEASDEPTIEEIRETYYNKFQKNVPNAKKNDAGWIKKKLSE